MKITIATILVLMGIINLSLLKIDQKIEKVNDCIHYNQHLNLEAVNNCISDN